MILKQSIKKGTIPILVIILFLFLMFSIKNDWLAKSSFFFFSNKNLIKEINKTSRVLALEYTPYLFPHFPQRLIYILSEINSSTEELLKLNEDLEKQLGKSDCQFASSQCFPDNINSNNATCQPTGVFGTPYESTSEIEEKKEEIADRIDDIDFLKNLLKKEMESGLPMELKTLRQEIANELEYNLNKTLEEIEKIINSVKKNQELYSKDYTENCSASCQVGEFGKISECFKSGSGPQKHIGLDAIIKVSLNDLNIKDVKINEFGIALPDKIQFPNLGDIIIDIPKQTVSVCSSLKPINIFINQPSITTFPTLSFTCPILPSTSIIPSSYQCTQSNSDEKIKTNADTNWYFSTLSWLMQQCSDLPSMKDGKGLPNPDKVKNCYQPDKVIGIIINECNNYWENYCHYYPHFGKIPEICKKMKGGCYNTIEKGIHKWKVLNGDIAAANQCQELFKKLELPIPLECMYENATKDYDEYSLYTCRDPSYPFRRGDRCVYKKFNPLSVLKKKCQELKKKYQEEPPEPCKTLPLLVTKIESPKATTTYIGPLTNCQPKELLNLPFGFGSGLGYNCTIPLPNSPENNLPKSNTLPTLPKIILPDIVIPDIILPQFNISNFLKIKLPSIIIEDLILPEIELCDLNNCSNIFPSLNFESPNLNLPPSNFATPVPQLSGLQIRGEIDFPSINFSLPQLNLFNLLLPKLKLPEIPLPSPKVDFRISGIDLGAIFDFISTFLSNAIIPPNYNLSCLNLSFAPSSLSLTFPDYYFSFEKFPEIPKIPFCKNINEFCGKVKNSLESNVLAKASEIENEFNKTIGEIQEKIDMASKLANKELQNQINKTLEIYGEKISNEVKNQLQKNGLSLEDYVNPQTKEIDLNKVPFPGAFPFGTIEKDCLPVSLPKTKIVLSINSSLPEVKTQTIKKPDGQTINIYIPLDLPIEIPITWPEKLKKITLNNPLTYSLPSIHLSDLNYEKKFSIKGPGFQPPRISSDFGENDKGECQVKPPTGGNPFPMEDINKTIKEIQGFKNNVYESFQKVIDILQ